MQPQTWHKEIDARLPIVVPPKAHESFLGYVLRLTQENLYETPIWILELCSEKLKSVYAPSFQERCIDGLSKLTGIRTEALTPITPRFYGHSRSTYVSVFGAKKVPIDTIRTGHPAICPLCVEKYGSTSAVWDLAFYLACPEHEYFLIENCNKCGKPLSWQRPQMNACRCGFNFSNAKLTSAPTAITWLSAFLETKVNSPPVRSETGILEPSKLDGVSLSELLGLARFLYCYFLETKTSERDTPFSLRKFSLDDKATYCHDIALFVKNWPAPLVDLMNELSASENESSKRHGLRRHPKFQDFHARVFNSSRVSRIDCLEHEVRKFVVENSLRRRIRLRPVNASPGVRARIPGQLNRGETMSYLGISARAFHHLLATGVLEGQRLTSGKVNVYRISEACVQRLKDQQDKGEVPVLGRKGNYLTIEGVKQRLCASRRVAAALVHHGALGSILSPKGCGSVKWAVRSDETLRFIDHLRNHFSPMFLAHDHYVDFSYLHQCIKKHGGTDATFIEDLLAGHFTPRRIIQERDGVNQFQYCTWDIWDAISQLTRTRPRYRIFAKTIPKALRLEKIAPALGTEIQYLRFMLDHIGANFIRSTGKGDKSITPYWGFKKIAEKYVSHTVLVQEMRRHDLDLNQLRDIPASSWISNHSCLASRFYQVERLPIEIKERLFSTA